LVVLVVHPSFTAAVARPKKDPDDRASAAFRIRLTAAERQRLDAMAAARGITLSRLIRVAVLDDQPPTPLPVREVIDQLNRIGAILEQIANHANAIGQLRADLDEALAEVRRAIIALLAE
jgi:hypothetical protein